MPERPEGCCAQEAPDPFFRPELLAFVAALIWTVHPLQSQAVTYVIQRCESLMGLFYLLCLYCLIRGARANRGWPWYVAGLAACWLGMGSKEVMITAPVAPNTPTFILVILVPPIL